MIGVPVHYYSDALTEPHIPRSATITGFGSSEGEVNITSFLDVRLDVRGKQLPMVVQRSSLALLARGEKRPPGVREWAVDCFAMILPAVEAQAEPGAEPAEAPAATAPATAPADLTEKPIEHGPLRGPLNDVISKGQAEPKKIRWRNGSTRSYVGEHPANGRQLMVLTFSGGKACLYACRADGKRGVRIGEWEGAPFPAIIDAADLQADDVLAAIKAEEAGE